MNKREMIHALIDKLLDIEETSQKGVHFNYSTAHLIDFYFLSRPKSFGDYVGSGRTSIYTFEDLEQGFSKALLEIEKIKNTPDPEPKVSVVLSEGKARELGLIA